MELIRRYDPAADSYIFCLTISAADFAGVLLDDTERQAADWFEEQPDIEAKLMALQIFVRKIEALSVQEV